jgi:ABC-type polysaccharide/polyol phosphate export permease
MSAINDRAADETNPGQRQLAVEDLLAGFAAWRIWGHLAWYDVRQRYRRSVLGPFWLTISMAVMALGLGVLYGWLLRVQVVDYLPYITAGLIIWGLMSSLILEGCAAFTHAEVIIKQVRLPLSLHVFRVVWRNLIVAAHNLVIYVIVLVVFGINPGFALLLVVPSLLLLCVNAVWLGLVLGIVCTRFRDIPQVIASLVQLVFFVTPILWKPELLSGWRAGIVAINPFYHFLELLQAPMLGRVPPIEAWLVVILIGVVGWLAAFALLTSFRRRVAYWL